MNNFNIHLEIRNPKKASNRYEIRNESLLPDEPVIRRAKEWNHGHHRNWQLGLGFEEVADQCNVGAAMVVLAMPALGKGACC